MRHRMRGRKLGRNSSHRKAMFRNMAASLIKTVRIDEDDPQSPRVPGRIITTVPKAKELRPFVEKLVTLARKAIPHDEEAEQYATSAERNSSDWKTWRNSEQWQKWAQAKAPGVTYRRKAFALLRDREAVDILFDEIAERFEDRPGGYTRVVELATRRLGDSGAQALIEFVGQRDRLKMQRKAPMVVDDGPGETTDDAPQQTATDDSETESIKAQSHQPEGDVQAADSADVAPATTQPSGDEQNG